MAETENTGGTTYEKGKLYDIPLNNLLADPNQPRKVMDAQGLDELSASIAKYGVLQPIIFSRNQSGGLIVVAGERRVAAARKAGLSTIPAVFVEENKAEIALVENLIREDLTAVEEAEALQGLMTGQKYTQEQLSAVIGKARTTITEILSLNRLPQEVRDDCRGDRTISKNTLIEIAQNRQTRTMIKEYFAYKAKVQKGKQAKKKGAAADPNAPQPVYDLLDRAMTRINTIVITDWSDEEKANLQTALVNLRDRIDAFLAAPPPEAEKPKKPKLA